MRATKVLPAAFQPYATIDLAKNKALLAGLTLLGLGLFFVFGWLFIQLAIVLRGGADAAQVPGVDLTASASGAFSFTLSGSWIVAVLLACFLVPVVHEATHGIFFWVFTRGRPRFAFKVLYAYAAAPDWYFPRGPYLLVGLAPLVLLSFGGAALLHVAPVALVPTLLAFLVFNAAGAVGDIVISIWLLFQPATLLARDTGDGITLYRAASQGGESQP
ncbi:MAG TPA: DUF3267 domain-containing protein [Ktedonobacterales bacterium]|jgi:hypothetical protein|nr:DUF3267 domain-containing protein [Ktedonobacterales bacterium]